MDVKNDMIKSVLKYLIDADEGLCRLCLQRIPHDRISLEDNVHIDKPYYKNTVTYNDMFYELGVSIHVNKFSRHSDYPVQSKHL
jgi:hypothetical protein